MRKLLIVILMAESLAGAAQSGDSEFLYRRGSIYSLMIGHRNQEYIKDIEQAFSEMPVPDKYNDHGLGKKVFYTSDKRIEVKVKEDHNGFVVNDEAAKSQMNYIDAFLQQQLVASRLVAKWYGRKKDGICNMQLIRDRGYNNASAVDKRVAELSVRREALLRDAGEELIGSTFVLVNDITYIDKSRGTSVVGGILDGISTVAAVAAGTHQEGQPGLGALVSSYKGFNVKIKTYLYQLKWDDATAGFFYNQVYTEQPDAKKVEAFENSRGKFSLIFLGMQESSGKATSYLGINEDEPEKMVRKACQRAFDENIANLQKNFDVFKVKVPLSSVEPLQCEIGLKEGITEKSRFEVLEVQENADGHVEYKRVGIIKPDKDKIWDNRYMATEEGADNTTLGATTFTKVSGGTFYPGLLVREMK